MEVDEIERSEEEAEHNNEEKVADGGVSLL